MIDTLDMPTLFKRGTGYKVIPELHPECVWAKDRNDTYLSIKINGTLCKVVNDEKWQKTLYRKHGELFFEVDMVNTNPMDIYVLEAYNNTKAKEQHMPEGFYVAIGPDINGNPQNVTERVMVKIAPAEGIIIVPWSETKIKRGERVSVQDFYDSIKAELAESNVEGIVFNWEKPAFHPFKLAKVTRKDFGMDWPIVVSEP